MTSDKPARPGRRSLLGGALLVPGAALAGCSVGNDDVVTDSSSTSAGVGPEPASSRVVRLSVEADTGADVTEAFAEAMEQLHPTQATTIQLDRGVYLVQSIAIPSNRTVIIRGMGIGYVGGSFGTQIRRVDDGAEPLLLAQGDTAQLTSAEFNTPPFRTRLELYDLELHGNESAGTGLRVFRGQQCHFERIRVSRCDGTALHLTQMFNSSLTRVFTGYSGGGEDRPAMLIDGTDEGSSAGTNTLHLTDCEWETNAGTDLVVDGFPGMPSVGILIANAKMERGGGDFPLIRVTRHGKLQLDNSYLYLGASTDHHLLETSGSAMLSNVHLAHGGSPDYQVLHEDGLLVMVAVQSEARLEQAVLRVAAEVMAGRCVVRGLTALDNSRLVRDERDLPVELGQQLVPVQMMHSTAPTERVAGGMAAGWLLRPGADSEVCIGQAVLPGGLPADAVCEVVLRWSANTAGEGDVALAATVSAVAPKASLTSRQRSMTVTESAPSRAGILIESALAPAFSVGQGDHVQLEILRDSSDEADTFGGDVLLLTVHLLVSSLP